MALVAVALLRHVFDRQDGLIQFSPIGGLFGGRCFGDGLELHKGVIAFQINAQQFAKGFKQHFQIFAFGGFFMKVDDKERIRGCNVLATFVFLTFDTSIATGKLDPDRIRNAGHGALEKRRRKEMVSRRLRWRIRWRMEDEEEEERTKHVECFLKKKKHP